MTVRIALAQMASSPDRADNLARALGAMDRAAEAGAQLIVFPEVALDRFFPQHERFERSAELASTIPGPVADRFAAKAKQHGLVTVMNLYETDGEGRFYDSSPVYDADGTLLGVTRMIHITDYACFHEKTYYHPGDRGAPVYQTKVGRIGVAICYDRHYPEYTRALGIQGAELVAIPRAGAVGGMARGSLRGGGPHGGVPERLLRRALQSGGTGGAARLRRRVLRRRPRRPGGGSGQRHHRRAAARRPRLQHLPSLHRPPPLLARPPAGALSRLARPGGLSDPPPPREWPEARPDPSGLPPDAILTLSERSSPG
ncbi:MAG: nitrilase-related carbon-nitrogen hydrolase [Gemmatimonadales bacterium]